MNLTRFLTRKLARRVALALAAFAFFVVLVIGLLFTEPARRYALSQLTSRLEQEGIGLRVKSIEVQPLALYASLHDVEVFALGKQEHPFLRAQDVNVGLMWSLGVGQPAISSIVVERPRVAIQIDSQGRSNLPILKPQQTNSKNVSIGELSLRNASLEFRDAQREISLSIPKWSGKIKDLKPPQSYRIEISTEAAATLRYRGQSQQFTSASADLDYSDHSIMIRKAVVESSGLHLSARGSIEDLKSGKLHVESEGDSAMLSALAGMGQRIRGLHSAQVDMTGEFASPTVRGHIEARDFYFDSYGPVRATTDFETQKQFARVQIKGLEAQWGAGVITAGYGDLALKDSAEESRVRAQFRGFSTAQLAKIAEAPNPPVSGVMSGALDVRFPALKPTPGNVRGVASVHIDPAPGPIPVAGDLRVKADAGVIAITVASLQGLAAAANGGIEIRNGSVLTGTMQVVVADAKATRNALNSAGLLKTSVADGSIKGRIDGTLTLGGTLRDPTARLLAESKQLYLVSSVAGTLALDATLSREIVDVRELQYASPTQFELLASGRMDRSKLDFKGNFKHVSAKELILATGMVPKTATLPDGPIRATFKIAGAVNEPAIDADVESTGLSILKQPLGKLRAAIAYARDTVSIRNLQLDRGAAGSLIGSGSWDTRLQQIAALATVRAYRIDTLELPDTTPVRMIVDGTCKAEGTATQPLTVCALQAKDFAIGPYAAKAASLTGNLTGKDLKAEAAVADWNAKATLRAMLTGAMPADFTVSFDNSPIEAIYTGASGRLTARANGSLQLAEPRSSLRAEAQLEKATVRLRHGSEEYPETRLEQPATAKYDGKYIDFTALHLTSGVDSKVMASGRIPLSDTDRTGIVRIQGDFDFDTLARATGAMQDGALKGRLRADAVLTGGGTDWQPAGRIELVNAEAAHPALPAPFTAINAVLALRDKQVQIESASAGWLGGLMTLGGRLPIGLLFDRPNSGMFELTADAANLKLDGLAAALSNPLSGEASFHVDLRGAGLDPTLWEGRLQASTLRVRIAQTEFEQQSALTISLARKLATIEPFTVIGPESSLQLSGSLSLEKPNPLALKVAGKINAALLQLFVPEINAEGDTRVDLAVSGTMAAPRLRGQLELAGVQGEIPSAQVVFEDLTGKVEFDGQRISIAKLTGQLNGGSLEVKGGADWKGRELGAVDIELHAKGAAWNVPEGLQTASDVDLRLTGSPKQYDIAGKIRILDGSYRESLVIERGLFRTLSSSAAQSADLLGRGQRTPIRLNVTVETVDPIIVANDLLNGEVTANLRVVGTLDRPGLIGRLDVNEGANFYLGGRNYLIDRGTATFANQSKIEPLLDVLGHTKAGGVDINLQARGIAGGKLDTSFTSDPPLPEPDIISLLVSGRKLRDLRGSETQIAQDQALSYLSGNLASTFSQQANRALGVNFVRIDPGLIADEAEPTARLTLGQQLTSKLGLVYSVNLRNSSDQIWVGTFDVTKRFQTRVVRQSDNSFRFQFQHDIELGGVAPPESAKKGRKALRIGEIEVQVPDGSPQDSDRFRARLGLKSGKPFDFFALRKGVDKLKRGLADDGYPEVRVRTRREEKGGVLNLSVNVLKGSRVDFRYEGSGVSRTARSNVARQWAQSSFDSLRIRQATKALQADFAKEGYYAAQVEVLVNKSAEGRKLVTLTTTRGRKYPDVSIDVPGAVLLGSEAITSLFPNKEARRVAALHPERLASRFEQYYRQRGYLDVKAKAARLDKNASLFAIAVPISEGTQAIVGKVSQQGSVDLTKDIVDSLQLIAGQSYEPAKVEAAKARAEKVLTDAGRTGSEVRLDAARSGNAVDLTFQIQEGRKRVISEVAVEGTQHVSDDLVRTQIGLKPGDVLTDVKLNEARRNLYSTGAFSLADIEVRDDSEAATRLVARLREVRPFEIRYGVLFDTERGPGGIFDIAARNVLGSARTIGARGRYDSRLQEVRAFFEQPSLLKLPLKFVNTGFVRREINSTFLTDRAGGSSYLEYRWRKPYLLNFGYRFEQVHTFERQPDPIFPFDIRLRIAPLTAGFSRDTRDELLDATKGSFTSHIVEWAPSHLGSQLQYAKYFGQYFYYRSLTKPSMVPWSGQMKSRVVYAAGVRYGIAAGMQGQDLVPSERFFGGGSNSVRGFAQDRLGPLAGTSPIGGESIFIANNELRFPIYRFVDGVGFADAGNVFERWRDFRVGEIRYTGGAGLRVRTPYFLFRLDYGLILGRRIGEPRGRLFFGIGQAF